MKTARIEISPLKGLYEKLPPTVDSCNVIENFTVNKKTGAWDNRIGYEKYFTSAAKYGPFNSDEGIQSVYVWNTKGGAKQHVLYEARKVTTGANRLRVLNHNPVGATNLEVGRVEATQNETGTQYNPYGRFLVITNGYDGPYKYDGERLLPLGFPTVPGSPSPWRPDASFAGTSNWQFYGFSEQGDKPLNVIYGLGRKTDDAWNVYKYKVAFLSESGSIGPLSAASESVAWQTSSSVGPPFTANLRQGVFLDGIPIGPAGTVARILYRTLNLKDSDTEDDLFYYVGIINNNTETNYSDYISDSSVGSLAPSNRIAFPASTCRFSATFGGCLFVDGGLNEPTRIYHSEVGELDAFSELNFFDVGSRDGGMITAMTPYMNQLIVFRERAIDLIRRDEQSGQFFLKPLRAGIGTKSPRSIDIIPNAGLAFLSEDGVWLINQEMQVVNISEPILDTIDRINIDLLPKACATYSKQWNEWHCYFAVDGSEKPNFGIVYHFNKQAWSTRPDWNVGCITSDSYGNIIFGNNTGKRTAAPSEDYEAGLFVISGIRTYGYNIILEAAEYITSPNPPDNAKLQTAWLDFGNPNLAKQVKHVYLYVLTTGNNEITINYKKDYEFEGSTASPSAKMQRTDYLDKDIYGTAVFGTDTWQRPLLTEIRYDIAQKTCRHFSFEVETSNDFIIVGYSVELTSNDTKTRHGRSA